MSSRLSDWEALNAYVDGELDPARRAEVAARIARDPALARHAAALTGVKAAFAVPDDVPAFDFGLPKAGGGRRLRWRAVAAAAVVVLAVSALWGADLGRQTDPAWLSVVATAHHSLAARQQGASPEAEQVAASAGFQSYVPDLAAAKLSLAAAIPIAVSGSPDGMALHYTGTRGCRVTYVTFPSEGVALTESLSQIETDGLTGYGWRVGAIGYALVARGMDPNRLKIIAVNVRAASRLHRPLDEASRTQLAQSRAESRACAA